MNPSWWAAKHLLIKAWFETLKEINGPGLCVDRSQWTKFAFTGELPCSPEVLGIVFPPGEPKQNLFLVPLELRVCWKQKNWSFRRRSVSQMPDVWGQRDWDRGKLWTEGVKHIVLWNPGKSAKPCWCVGERGLRSSQMRWHLNPATQQARRWFRITNGSGWYRLSLVWSEAGCRALESGNVPVPLSSLLSTHSPWLPGSLLPLKLLACPGWGL